MSEEQHQTDSRPRIKVNLIHGIRWNDSIYKEVTVCEMQDDEEKILGSKNPDMEFIVRNCLVAIGKESPTRAQLQRDIIPNIQLGDYNRIVLDLRRLSLTDSYKYKSRCPSCRTISRFEVDLSTIEDIGALESTDDLTYELRSGKLAVFRPLFVKDEDALVAIGKDKNDALRKSLALRLVSIDGEAASEPGDQWKKHIAKGLKLMKSHGLVSMGEREAIRSWFKEETVTVKEDEDFNEIVTRKAVDAKVDRILEDTCPVEGCGTTWRHFMEIDPSFLQPSSAE